MCVDFSKAKIIMTRKHIHKPETRKAKKPSGQSPTPMISKNQYDAIHQLHATHGNQFVTRMLQRQEVEEASEEDHQDPRATAPDMWTPEKFQEEMRYFDNRAGNAIDWLEHATGTYDEDLAEIQELLVQYHAAKDVQEPEVARQKKLMDLVNTIIIKSNLWMAKNHDSSRLPAMQQFVVFSRSARNILQNTSHPYLGTDYVFGSTADLSYLELRSLDQHLVNMIDKTEGAEDKAALESSRQQTKIDLHNKVNELFSQFPGEILSNKNLGVPTDPDERIQFLEYMSSYLGDIDDVVNHFKNIRLAQVPGVVWIHESAATRLEGVKDDLGGFDMMPASYVGLGVRDRFRVHTRNSRSRMAHPLGFAMDYRPFTNQMLTGRNFDLANLDARMQSGNPDEKITMDLGGQNARRGLISDMGNGKADAETVEKFDQALDAEFERVSNLSENFGSALGADALPKLLELSEKRKENDAKTKTLDKQIASLQRTIGKLQAKKEPSADEQAQLTALNEQMEELEAQKTALQQEHYQIWDGIQKILAPYIQQIEKEQAALGEDVNSSVDEKLGEGIMLLDSLETSIKQEIDNIIAFDGSENTTEILKAYEDFFKNYKDTYAEVVATTQATLSTEEYSKNNKRKMAVYFQQHLDSFTELEQQFTTLRPKPQPENKETVEGEENTEPVQVDGQESTEPAQVVEGQENTEPAQPEISDEMSQVMDQTKSNLFSLYDKVIDKQQSKENRKVGSSRGWRGTGEHTYRDLEFLKNSLMWDAGFLFDTQSKVRNSSVVNTLDKGYFNADESNIDNPNPENDKSSKEHASKGFNLEFIRAMAKRGFDLGVAWSTSTDAMHFELVDGVDNLPENDDVQAQLDQAYEDLVRRGFMKRKNER